MKKFVLNSPEREIKSNIDKAFESIRKSTEPLRKLQEQIRRHQYFNE